MARTVKEIKDEMAKLWIAETSVKATYGLEDGRTFDEQFSKVSLENIWFYVVAFCEWTLETLFDRHREEMETLYSQHHAHTLEWYNNKAKAFMYGHSPVPFTGDYSIDDSMTDEAIAKAKIVTHASCVKGISSNNTSFLRLKVAKKQGDSLTALSPVEKEAFSNYMHGIQDAGVDLVCTSDEADHISMKWHVYYDPQILDSKGNRLDGTGSDVVKQAITDYVQDLPFNGMYKLTYHIDAVQKVPGVMDAYIKETYTHPVKSNSENAVSDVGVIADAGYFKFYDAKDLDIQFTAFA